MQNLVLRQAESLDTPDVEFLMQEYWFGEAQPVDDPEQEAIEEPDTFLRRPKWLRSR